MDKIIKNYITEIKEISETERTFTATASTENVDRDREVLTLKGWDLTNYKKNPVVLWAHTYDVPPIAKSVWTKVVKGEGLMFKPQFATTDFANDIFDLYKGGFLKSFSVGFKPVEWKDGVGGEEPRRTYLKQELLEISSVPVPANPGALISAMSDGIIKSKAMQNIITSILDYKTAIPYSIHGDTQKAPEDATWDAGAELRAIGDDLAKLKKMCTWYDRENQDTKAAYKLPHHKASNLAVVWTGVRAAMGALLGARGGVSIPSADRKGLYNHLVKHYQQFDKEPPEFREYQENIINIDDFEIKLDQFDSRLIKLENVLFKSVEPETTTAIVKSGPEFNIVEHAENKVKKALDIESIFYDTLNRKLGELS